MVKLVFPFAYEKLLYENTSQKFSRITYITINHNFAAMIMIYLVSSCLLSLQLCQLSSGVCMCIQNMNDD